MSAALELSTKARTDRERLKAAEAVRSATALAVRALRGGHLDNEMLDLLDRNIVHAAELYRAVGGFENELRGLAGHREAVRQRLEAVHTPEAVEVPVVVAFSDGKKAGEGTMRMRPEQLWRGVPSRFRDESRCIVERTISLAFHATEPHERIVVRECDRDVLAWTHETQRKIGGQEP